MRESLQEISLSLALSPHFPANKKRRLKAEVSPFGAPDIYIKRVTCRMWKKDIYGRVKDQMVGAELSPLPTQMIGAEPFTICSSTPIFFPVKTTEIVDGLCRWAIHYVQRFNPYQKGKTPHFPM